RIRSLARSQAGSRPKFTSCRLLAQSERIKMRKLTLRSLLLGMALALPVVAQAQVDQSQYAYNASWWSSWAFGTTFKPSQSNIKGASIWLRNVTTNNVIANLRVAAFGTDAAGNPTLADVTVKI